MKRILLLILLSSLFFSCAKKAKSDATFKILSSNLALTTAQAGGGAFIWGMADNGDKFAKKLNVGTNEINFELNNATWDFFIIAWDGIHGGGVDEKLVGSSTCAAVEGLSLTGGDEEIVMNLDDAQCSNPKITNSRVSNSFRTLNLYSCLDATGASADNHCDADNQGFYSSFKVMLISYKNEGGAEALDYANSVESFCYQGDRDTAGAISNPTFPNTNFKGEKNPADNSGVPRANIPTGIVGGESPFYTVIKGYYSSETCDDADIHGVKEFHLKRGIGANHPQKVLNDAIAPTDNDLFLVADQAHACSGGRDSMTFAFGSNFSFYKGICNLDQLNNIGGSNFTTPMRDYNFILLNNIDAFAMAGWDPNTDLYNEPTLPAFTSIGDTYATADSASYNGLFHGNGKNIIGLEVKVDNEASQLFEVGFIRELNGEIRDMTFLFSRIEASDDKYYHLDVGGIVGHLNGGAITDVDFIAGEVEGVENVGGIVGKFAAGTINNIFAKLTSVDGSMNVGGIVGYNGGGTSFNKLSFDGHIEGEGRGGGFCVKSVFMITNDENPTDCASNSGSWTNSSGVGGILGRAGAPPSTFSELVSHGVIMGAGSIGGIVGHDTTAGMTISDSYTTSFIRGGGPNPPFVGGIIGQATNPITLERTFNALGITTTGTGTPHALIGTDNCSGGCTFNYSLFQDSVTANQVDRVNYAQMRTQAMYAAGSYDFGTVWAMDDDGFDFPRLQFEEARKCVGDHAGDFAGGNGTAANPFLICNKNQLASLRNPAYFDSGYHFKVLRKIDMGQYPGLPNTINPHFIWRDADLDGIVDPGEENAQFVGHLDGDGKILGNFHFDNATQPAKMAGLFSRVHADSVLSNIMLTADIRTNTDGGLENAGLLVAENFGHVKNAIVIGTLYTPSPSTTHGNGCIAGANQGHVVGSLAGCGIFSKFNVGGIVGHNTGVVALNEVRSQIFAFVGGGVVGGAVGKNEATGISSPTMYLNIANQQFPILSQSGLVTENIIDSAISHLTPGLIGTVGGAVGAGGGEISNNEISSFIKIDKSASANVNNLGGVIGNVAVGGEISHNAIQVKYDFVQTGPFAFNFDTGDFAGQVFTATSNIGNNVIQRNLADQGAGYNVHEYMDENIFLDWNGSFYDTLTLSDAVMANINGSTISPDLNTLGPLSYTDGDDIFLEGGVMYETTDGVTLNGSLSPDDYILRRFIGVGTYNFTLLDNAGFDITNSDELNTIWEFDDNKELPELNRMEKVIEQGRIKQYLDYYNAYR